MIYYEYTIHPEVLFDDMLFNGMKFSKTKPIRFVTIQEQLQPFVDQRILQYKKVDTQKENNFFYISPLTQNIVYYYTKNELFQKPTKFIYSLAQQIGIPTHTEKNIPKSRDFLALEILHFQEETLRKLKDDI